MQLNTVSGDLLDQDVDAIVNPWNRNLIPWWLLLPAGVSGAIRRKAGVRPFIELRRYGVLKPGSAVVTAAGRLPFKAIIHVAGIGHDWCSSEDIVRTSFSSVLREAKALGFNSIATPLIGAGVGGVKEDIVRRIIKEECHKSDYAGSVVIVLYKPAEWPYGDCYCHLWEKSPETLQKQGVPHGYCGVCDSCGKPGHLLHFPGSVPFTGGWCKMHYYRAMFFHPLGIVGFFVWILGIIAIIALIRFLLM